MFQKTPKEHQLGMFSSPSSLLNGKSKDYYEKDLAWHNLFRKQVTMRIEEGLFSVLFSEGMGAPNKSIRVLIAMMVIKEAFRWSDIQLYEQCRYNLLVRSALGLLNIDDAVPAESTYYLLRKRIVEHEKAGGENLIEKAFTAVTREQAIQFEVSGKSIRMDSKLLGSNIAWYSRYELVHETLRLFYKDIQPLVPRLKIGKATIAQLEAVLGEGGDKVVYRSSGDELQTKLQSLGILMDRLLRTGGLKNRPHYATLERVFHEQFRVGKRKEVITRNKEEITSDSVQSPHDTDCHYRDKGGNKVKGYSINLTENCDKGEVHLISQVDVQPVSVPDTSFLQPDVGRAGEVFGNKPENLHTDGAYHSPDNQQYCKDQGINFYLNAIQGAKGRYDFRFDEKGALIVTDTVNGEPVPVWEAKGKAKWRIKTASGGSRHFTQKEIDACLLRKQIAGTPIEILQTRNNVEASIFQLGYHYPNDKSRYRGLIKHIMWANIRCLWVNFVRILKFVKQICQRTALSAKSALENLGLALNFAFCIFITLILSNNLSTLQKSNRYAN